MTNMFDNIIDQYRHEEESVERQELAEIIAIAKIEETGALGEFLFRDGNSWAFTGADGLGHRTWDLDATLAAARGVWA